ncbi:MAG: four helix bundle protein [Tepidisphaerales bacterium]
METATQEGKVVRTFRDLVAWQKAMTLARSVYEVTTTMPDAEKFGLTMQMRRSAVSIPSNIAEGHGRQSRADYLRFLRLARGSLAELSTQVELASQIGMLKCPAALTEQLEEVDRVLQGLIRSVERLADPQ